MPSVDVTVTKLVIGENPGPVSITCVEGETPYTVTMREVVSGDTQVIQVCVPNDTAPCDATGIIGLLSAAGWEVVDSGCP